MTGFFTNVGHIQGAKLYSFVKNRMRNYFRQYSPFLLFLARFFLTYIALASAYQFYLSHYDDAKTEIDPATVSVGRQASWLANVLGADTFVMPHPTQAALRFSYNGKFVARIIEGCNAISVMILFVAFVVAFRGKWRMMTGFIVSGIAIIHILNVVRIAMLASAIYHYPAREEILHGVVFPLFIYGVVFLLWVIWVNKFSDYALASKTR
jgi:exosortase family protein XrtF